MSMTQKNIEKMVDKIINTKGTTGIIVAVLDGKSGAQVGIDGNANDVLSMIYAIIQSVSDDLGISIEEILEAYKKVEVEVKE